MQPGKRKYLDVVTVLFPLLAACGGDTAAPPAPPVIEVMGVEDGATYRAPVSATIRIDRGSYDATLNGALYLSGNAISQPGDYTLRVTARSDGAVASKEIRFKIEGTGAALTIRLFDLGPNDSGGGGDAILLADSTGAPTYALIDAGPGGTGANDPGLVARRLAALNIDTLAFVQLTHAHADHYQGMNAVFSAIEVRRFIYNGQVRSLGSYNTLVSVARGQADSTIVPAAIYDLRLGRDTSGSRISVIPPLPTFLANPDADGDEINEGSLGTRLTYRTFEMFFTGDGEVAANVRWRTTYATLSRAVDVLKVGHHAANNAIFDNGFSGTSTWLDHTAPTVSVISANGTSHPRLNALTQLLSRSNNRTYCTNVHGDLTIRVSRDGTFEVTVQRNAGMNCVRGTEATT